MTPPLASPHDHDVKPAKSSNDWLVKNLVCLAGLFVGGCLILGGIGAYWTLRVKDYPPEYAVDNSVQAAIQAAAGPIAGGLFIMGAGIWFWSRPSSTTAHGQRATKN